MGNSLHNKIHLGRSSWLDSRGAQLALAFGMLAGVALAWAAVHGWR
ncbi:MAG: hypothetical protein ACXWC4_21645 [Telluria sp.]